MGLKYAFSITLKNTIALNKLLITRATANAHCLASIAPKIRYHLLKKPQVGGIPTTESAVIVKAAIVKGIFLWRCLKLVISLVPILYMMAPVTKNRHAIIKASFRICRIAPVKPILFATLIPNTIYPTSAIRI